jgi:hypothetical protein
MKNTVFWKWRLVSLPRIDISEKIIASIIRVERIRELGTTLAVTSNWSTLRWNTTYLVTANIVPSSRILSTLMTEGMLTIETLFLSRTTRPHIP